MELDDPMTLVGQSADVLIRRDDPFELPKLSLDDFPEVLPQGPSQAVFDALLRRGQLDSNNVRVFSTPRFTLTSIWLPVDRTNIPLVALFRLVSRHAKSLVYLSLPLIGTGGSSAFRCGLCELKFPKLRVLRLCELQDTHDQIVDHFFEAAPELAMVSLRISNSAISITKIRASLAAFLAKPNNIIYLELSPNFHWPIFMKSVGKYHMTSLHTLILHCVARFDSHLAFVHEISSLRVLDISGEATRPTYFDNPSEKLYKIVSGLPFLEHLDISFTDLSADDATSQETCKPERTKSKIPGLRGLHKPLTQLGLYWCVLPPAYHSGPVPASQVLSGDSPREIIAAARHYSNRVQCFRAIVHDLTEHDDATIGAVMDVVADAMRARLSDPRFIEQMFATIGPFVKRKMIGHEKLIEVLKTICCRVIASPGEYQWLEGLRFLDALVTIAEHVMDEENTLYARLILHFAASAKTTNEQLLTFLMACLHNMTCGLTPKEQSALAAPKTSAFNKMFSMVQRRLKRMSKSSYDDESDKILESCWSVMWNLTDENERNCDIFVKKSGMRLALDLCRRFLHEAELLTNITGLLGNIAEVPKHRHLFFSESYLSFLLENLWSTQPCIGYNCAGILCNILASDGRWSVPGYPRRTVVAAVRTAVEKWNVRRNLFMKFKSLKPVLCLAQKPDTFAWPIFVVANLTTLNIDRNYVDLLLEENGLPVFEQLSREAMPKHLKDLVEIVLENVKKHVASEEIQEQK